MIGPSWPLALASGVTHMPQASVSPAHSAPAHRTDGERRRADPPPAHELKKRLNIEQLAALVALERFGWYLKFVRHNPPQPPVAVLCDPDRPRYALLDAAGDLHENPVFEHFRSSDLH
jgi:hypothetical protein